MPSDHLPITITTRDYDFVAPLALGDVTADGIVLTMIRRFDAVEWFPHQPAIHGGEASFSFYLHRVVAGDRSLVGLPVFVMREFRHRCLVVRRHSGLTDLAQLRGRTVGIDSWAATGNVWTKGLFRERGMPLDSMQWVVGPVDAGDPPAPAATLPGHARRAPAGKGLSDLLLAGEIDALMSPWPARPFHEPDSRLVRLYEDYRAAERAYYQRTRLFPAHHIVVLRRPLVEEHPWVVGRLYRAFVEARVRSVANHRVLHESSPWILADLEDQEALMGCDFSPYGYRENRPMVEAFCREQHAQGLIEEPLDPDTLFADFERLLNEDG